MAACGCCFFFKMDQLKQQHIGCSRAGECHSTWAVNTASSQGGLVLAMRRPILWKLIFHSCRVVVCDVPFERLDLSLTQLMLNFNLTCSLRRSCHRLPPSCLPKPHETPRIRVVLPRRCIHPLGTRASCSAGGGLVTQREKIFRQGLGGNDPGLLGVEGACVTPKATPGYTLPGGSDLGSYLQSKPARVDLGH